MEHDARSDPNVVPGRIWICCNPSLLINILFYFPAFCTLRLGPGRTCGDIIFVPSGAGGDGGDADRHQENTSGASCQDVSAADASWQHTSLDEEDGNILVMVHVLNEDQPRTELLVLGMSDLSLDGVAGDDISLAGGGQVSATQPISGGMEVVATVHIPIRVPFGFHNEFVNGGELLGWST